jgi:hypothetical protein
MTQKSPQIEGLKYTVIKNYYIFFAPLGRTQASLALTSLIAKINL